MNDNSGQKSKDRFVLILLAQDPPILTPEWYGIVLQYVMHATGGIDMLRHGCQLPDAVAGGFYVFIVP